jgi:hypothetical protein
VDIEQAFNTLQTNVNADPEAVKEARRRRNLFIDAFQTLADVDGGRVSGSLARGSQIDPIRDVDTYIEFDEAQHPTWGTPGTSAQEALDYTQTKVRELLGITEGSFDRAVRLATTRNHSVKCFLDDPEDADAFTVDVMPVLKQGDGSLLIPEARSNCWVPANPQYLIDEVAARHASWNRFVPVVRLIKRWTREQSTGIKPLVLEVMALTHLPEASTRGEALKKFFAAANYHIAWPVEDPAGLCGEIQPDMDKATAQKFLEQAAEISFRAEDARERGETDEAACLWRKLFGDAFPEPEGGCGGIEWGGAIGGGAGVVVSRPRKPKDTPQG